MRYFIAFLFFILPAFSANWYVRKGATGSNNGTNWTNAWNEMSSINFSSVACGDTIWLAGGTYTTALSVNKSCTSSTVLKINRVLSTDSVPTAAAGWASSYDSQVIISNNGINLAGGAYYTINGRVGSVASNNFGISVKCTSGSGGCDAIDGAGSGNLSNITLTYLELFGPSCVMAENCGGGGASGLNVAPSNNSVTSLLVDHCWIHQWGELIRTSNWKNCIIQYTSLSDTHNDGQQHEDVVYNYAQTNFTMRYNSIWGTPNDGIFFDFGGTVGFYFYGNVYFHTGGEFIVFKPGYTNATNIYIYNNVFESDGWGDYSPGWLDFTGAANSGEVANNVFENVDNTGTPPNGNHNAYSLSGTSDGGSGSFYYSPGKLGASVDFLNEDPSVPDNGLANFHLTAAGATAFANGKTLAAPYNVDIDGNTRGASGSWTIGAYQYVSGTTSPTAPNPPTGLTVVVH
jgi:hypothetical protein